MDNSGNDENKNVESTAQQGIFSTPELTVDAEKLAQNAEEVNAASRAKIASIFANTETGQQAQRLNDAMEANTEPATEDIVINNGVKKKKKWPIVVGVLALVATIVGVGTWFLVQSLGGQVKETPAEKFAAYLKLVQDGPENLPVTDEEAGTANSSNTWFLLRLNDSGLQQTELKAYLDAVKTAYDNFNDIFTKTETANASMASSYKSLLSTYLQLGGFSIISETLADKYLNEGQNAAYNYIQSFTSDELTPLEQNGIEQLKKYLDEELTMLAVAEAEGCVVDGDFDQSCRMNLNENSNAYYESLQQQQKVSANMTNILRALGNNLKAQTEILEQEVANEKE